MQASEGRRNWEEVTRGWIILVGMEAESIGERESSRAVIGLGMSPGLRWVLASILMGILMGNMTHGSGSPTETDR